MSKRCHDPEYDSSRSPSPSKRRHSRCRRRASQGRSSSCSSRSHGKSKNTRKTKKSYCDSAKSGSSGIRSIEKKARIERLPNSETAESCSSEVKKRGRKNNKREAKRRKKKKKITNRKKLSRSSACTRLIDLLLKSCTCLENLDPSSTFPNGDNACCCKCRLCRPDCESKSVQCDDCENFFAPPAARSRDETRGSGREANEEADGRSWEYLTHDESGTGRKKNDFRGREYEESLNIRSQKRKNKSDSGICGAIVRSFSSIKNFGKRRNSAKSLTNDREISENDPSKLIRAPKKNLEFNKSEEENYRVGRRCRTDDGSKAAKALLIIFDIVFWPYTCLPGRRSVRK